MDKIDNTKADVNEGVSQPVTSGLNPQAALKSLARGIVSVARSQAARDQFIRDLLTQDECICGQTLDVTGVHFWRHGASFAFVDEGELVIRIRRQGNDLPIPPHLREWRPEGKPVPNWRIAHAETGEWLELAIRSLLIVEEETNNFCGTAGS